MSIDVEAARRKTDLAIEATKKGELIFSIENGIDDFNKGCDHVAGLVENSYQLFNAGAFSTSIFIAITVIEEIAKLEIASFRNTSSKEPASKRRKDPLFNHGKKHSIALQETIAIGSRLQKVIGSENVRKLLDMSEDGELSNMREASLYADVVEGNFVIPSERFTITESREVLLLALEVWDDRLVGYTEHTAFIDQRMLEIFKCVSKAGS